MKSLNQGAYTFIIVYLPDQPNRVPTNIKAAGSHDDSRTQDNKMLRLRLCFHTFVPAKFIPAYVG